MNPSEILPEIITAIKAKKEISTIEEVWIQEQIIWVLEKEKRIREKIHATRSFAQFSRSKEYEFILKRIRKKLHAVYGTFQRQMTERHTLFEELKMAYKKNDPDMILSLHEKILMTHRSTKERLPFYTTLYPRIFAKTGVPKVILDLSCGLNPFSYPWMNAVLDYNATELTQEDCLLMKDYFQIMGIRGEVMQLNLIKEMEKVKRMKADICLAWKLLDTLEYMERNISRRLLPLINTPWIVVSFSTKTLSGKSMKKTRRLWFEKICKENTWRFSTEEFENELFYVVKKW